MSIRIKSLVAALCLTGIMTSSASATKTSNEHRANRNLEMQLALLQKKVNALEYQVAFNSHSNDPINQSKASSTRSHIHSTDVSRNASRSSRHSVTSKRSAARRLARVGLTRRELARTFSTDSNYLPFDIDVPGQAFVSTGPYIGVPISYKGSDLIINSPSVNTDLQLLNIRKSIQTKLREMLGGLPVKETHSHLLLSGIIETNAGYFKRNGRSDTSDIDVTNVSLDAFILGPSNWILGFIEFSYDNGIFHFVRDTKDTDVSSNHPGYSRVYVNKAFVTIGDLTQTPYYLTFGQFYVPFGRYSSIMISDPLTKLLARTKARAVQIGFQQPGDNALYGSAYIFRGDSHAAVVSRINNGGVNLALKFKHGDCFSYDIGGGLIANIADSGGLQFGNGFQFAERINHRVPAYNLRGIFSISTTIDIIAEFVGVTTSFDVDDMSYKDHGAKPWASDIEAGYSFKILNDKPSTLGIGWSQSHEALTLGLPMTRFYIVFNTALLKSTLQAIELRRDKNYGSSIQANGPTRTKNFSEDCTAVVCHASGRWDTAIQVSFDYYF